VVLVVRQMRTTHPEFLNALTSLNFANTKILGVILNGIRSSEQDKYLKKSYKKYNGY
jgi:Mrp family chromosome partitioning ATPase